MNFKDALMSTLLLSFCTFAQAGSICISSYGGCDVRIAEPGTVTAPPIVNRPPISGEGIVISRNGTISVDGDLYLDYSIFSDNQDLNISSESSISGEIVTIYSDNDKPFFPNSYQAHVISNSEVLFAESGDWLLFSAIPFSSGTFEATGNLYIGNYSSLAPVPLPSSIFLFLSGIVFPAFVAIKRNLIINQSQPCFEAPLVLIT